MEFYIIETYIPYINLSAQINVMAAQMLPLHSNNSLEVLYAAECLGFIHYEEIKKFLERKGDFSKRSWAVNKILSKRILAY